MLFFKKHFYMAPNIIKTKTKTKSAYQCNLPHDCSGNLISWKFNPTIRAAIPSNSMPNPTPSSGSGTTSSGGKWSNYGVDAALFAGGSGFVYRRTGKSICNGRVGGFAPNPIRHWRKQLMPRQGGCSGKNSIANMMDTPGSAITLTEQDQDQQAFTGNYTDIYINKTLSIKEQCEFNAGICTIENHKKQLRPIPTYSRDYHSSSKTYLQSRGRLYRQQNAVNFKKSRAFPCKKQQFADYPGLYNTTTTGCFLTDGSCAVALVFDPVNAAFGTNTAVAGSLYAQSRAQKALTQNQFNIINRWGLDGGVSQTKIYPVVRTKAPGYRKLNGGTGINVVCCPAFVPPPLWLGEGFFIMTLTDELWARIRAYMGSDLSSVPVISNTSPPEALPIIITPDLDSYGNLNGRTRVTVEYHYHVGDPITCGFTMTPLLDALYSEPSFNDLSTYDINIVQWGAIPFAFASFSDLPSNALFRSSIDIFNMSGQINNRITWYGQNQAVTLYDDKDQLPISQWHRVPQIDTPLLLPSSTLAFAFAGCATLTTADFGNINRWDISKMTNQLALATTFNGCTNFNSYLGDWDTRNITTLIATFANCTNFEGNGLENWNTENVTDMTFLFSQCTSLKADIGNWNVGKCGYFNQAFQNCVNFTGNLITNWRPAAVISMQYMFAGCINFNPTGDLSYWDVSQCQNFDHIFSGCIKFQGAGLSSWRTDNMTTAQAIFNIDFQFNQDLSGWNVTKLINIIGGPSGPTGPQFGPMVDAFYGCIGMSVKNMTSTLVGWGQQILDPSAYNISLGMYGTTYYVDKYGVLDLSNIYGWNYNSLGAPYFSLQGYLPPIATHVVPTYLTGLTDWHYAYYKSRGWPADTIGADPSNIPALTAYPTISGDYIVPESDFSLWTSDASSVTNMSYMFADCSGFPGLGCSSWNPVKLVNANGMFQRCAVLNINFGGWNTATLQYATKMFDGCTAFQGAGLSLWNTANLLNAGNMFNDCLNLVSVDTSVSYWNVAKCQNFASMFKNCPKFIGDGLPNWNTSSATNFAGMFENDVSFNAGVSRWQTNKVIRMNSMFKNCATFNRDLSGWSIRSLLDASGMLNNTAMSDQNYTDLLYRWGFSSYIQRNVPLGANNCYYYHDAVIPKANLVTNYMWVITDLGPTPPFAPGLAALTDWSRMFLGSVGQATNLAGQPFPAPIPGIAIVSGSEFAHWDASMVVTTQSMFQDCSNFKGGGLDAWIAPKSTGKIKNFSSMFQGCAAFNQNLGGWIVTSGISMESMFSGCASFIGTGVPKWHPTSATTMAGMFKSATLFNQDLSGWASDISNVTTMSRMFQNCSSFTGNSISNTSSTSLKLWNTAAVTDMSGMFQGASVFNQDLSWNMATVTSTAAMFKNATTFNGNIKAWNTANTGSMDSMFQGATAFNQDLSGWNTGNVTTMRAMFQGATAFNQNIGYWDTSNVQDMSGMFQGAVAFNQDLSGFEISSLTTAANMLSGSQMSTQNYTVLLQSWGQAGRLPQTGVPFGAQGIQYYQWAQTGRIYLTATKGWLITDGGLDSAQIGFPPNIAPLTNWSYMFINGIGSTIDPSYQDISGYIVTGVSNFSTWIANNVTNFNSMFIGCLLFTGIGLPLWNTASAINMGSVFQNCAVFNQDLSGWTTTGVINMSYMFQNCKAFNRDLRTWNTSNVVYMNYMFSGCNAFTGAGLSSWQTGSVVSMAGMFQTCYPFNQDVSGWNTANVTSMSAMFQDCSAFNRDLSNWNISALTNAANMIDGTSMSTQNYSNLLIGWAAQAPAIQANVVFGAAGLKYDYFAATSHDILTRPPYNWIITDAGQSEFSMTASLGAITDWSYMFYNGVGSTINTAFRDVSGYVLSLTTDFTLWYPTIVKNFTAMFQNTAVWQGIGLPRWNTSKATTMVSMFKDCPTFNQDLSGWIVENVTNMRNMFSGCTAFDADLSRWDISNVVDVSGMLDNCGMSPQNYSLILYYWARQAQVKHVNNTLTLGAQGLTYFPWAASARTVLTSAPYNWVIIDSGVNLIQIGYPPTIEQIIDWSNMFNGGQG